VQLGWSKKHLAHEQRIREDMMVVWTVTVAWQNSHNQQQRLLRNSSIWNSDSAGIQRSVVRCL